MKIDENGLNNEGPLPFIPFDGFYANDTTQSLSLTPYSLIVSELELTQNQLTKPYQVIALDFANKSHTYLYTIEEQQTEP